MRGLSDIYERFMRVRWEHCIVAVHVLPFLEDLIWPLTWIVPPCGGEFGISEGGNFSSLPFIQKRKQLNRFIQKRKCLHSHNRKLSLRSHCVLIVFSLSSRLFGFCDTWSVVPLWDCCVWLSLLSNFLQWHLRLTWLTSRWVDDESIMRALYCRCFQINLFGLCEWLCGLRRLHKLLSRVETAPVFFYVPTHTNSPH